MNLMMAFFQSGRMEQLAEEVAMEGAWRKDPRALLMQARVTVMRDREAGIEELKAIFRANHHWALRRFGGFEAVGHLDKLGRYREAFDLATEVHRATTGPLELDEWMVPLRAQVNLLRKGPGFFKPRADPVQGVAFVVAMPRSGTTLLEQMLDRHPSVSGIGEFDGLDYVCRSLFDGGPWPRIPAAVPDARFRDLQKHYIEGSRQIRREGATWIFDKSLRTWRALPEVLATLPGAVCINVDRDPRDVATSIFLSYFNPTTYEWTQSFDAIRQIIEMQRGDRAARLRGARPPERLDRLRRPHRGAGDLRGPVPQADGPRDGRARAFARAEQEGRVHALVRAGPAADQQALDRPMEELRVGVRPGVGQGRRRA